MTWNTCTLCVSLTWAGVPYTASVVRSRRWPTLWSQCQCGTACSSCPILPGLVWLLLCSANRNDSSRVSDLHCKQVIAAKRNTNKMRCHGQQGTGHYQHTLPPYRMDGACKTRPFTSVISSLTITPNSRTYGSVLKLALLIWGRKKSNVYVIWRSAN